jgi:hypothetical protein
MPTRVDILYPINTSDQNFNPTQMISSTSSGLVYKVQGYSTIVSQISCPLDAGLSGDTHLQCSLDGYTWSEMPGGNVSYNTVGVQQAVNVEGLVFIRYQTSTLSGTSEVFITLTGVIDA